MHNTKKITPKIEPDFSRIMIFGRPGSGKSTFSFKLHTRTGIALYHLDRYFYIENWIERNYQDFLTIQQNMVHQNQWIIDGNCIRSLEMRFERANLCLYFNYPRWKCYIRIFKRYLCKNHNILDRAEGCKETIQCKLLMYMWTLETRVHKIASNLQEKYPHVKFIEVRNDSELKKIEQLFWP